MNFRRVLLVGILLVCMVGTVSATTDLGAEDDGDLTEWNNGQYGNSIDSASCFSTTSSPSVSGNSISCIDTDSDREKISKPIQQPSGNAKYSFNIRQSDDGTNQEVQFWRSSDGAEIWGVYMVCKTSDNPGIYWSKEEERTSGTVLKSSCNVDQFYNIEFRNIDYSSNSLEVWIDGSKAKTVNFHNSASNPPDALQIYANWGGTGKDAWFDEITYTLPNTAPSIDSVSSEPSSWTLGSDVDVSADVVDVMERFRVFRRMCGRTALKLFLMPP